MAEGLRKRAHEALLRRLRDFRFGRELRCVQNRLRAADGCVLFTRIRDDMDRLAVFHAYYRALGVDHFVFVDDGAGAGEELRQWCAGRQDVSLWAGQGDGEKEGRGLCWHNLLLRRYGTGRLCVSVAPDEFLVYPHMESRTLKDLGRHLKEIGRPVLPAVTLDAYGARPAAETVLAPGSDPFRLCPYFDRDGYVQRRNDLSGITIQGGPRLRLFHARTPKKAPALDRIPVVWWQRHYRYRSSGRNLWPLSLNRATTKAGLPLSACLFRFAFVASPKNRDGGAPLLLDGLSVRYENPAQLLTLGLMNEGEWV